MYGAIIEGITSQPNRRRSETRYAIGHLDEQLPGVAVAPSIGGRDQFGVAADDGTKIGPTSLESPPHAASSAQMNAGR